MEIGHLADHEKFLSTLVQWHHQEWACLRPGDTIEARTVRLRQACGHKQIPTVLIAFSGETLLGSAMLVAHDMDTRTDLSPWLAGVFVAPGHRCCGIGEKLVERVVEEAGALGGSRLYIYTPSSEGFYTRLGWKVFERTQYRGVEVAVMTRELEPAPSHR